MTKITHEDLKAAIAVAITKFGAYDYENRGPSEVMDVTEFAGRIETELSLAEGNALLLQLAESGDEHQEMLASDLYNELPFEYDDPFDDSEIVPIQPGDEEEGKGQTLKEVMEGLKATSHSLD